MRSARTSPPGARTLRRTSLILSTVLIAGLLQAAALPVAAMAASSNLPGMPASEKPVAGAKVSKVLPRKAAKGPRVPEEKPRAAAPAASEISVTLPAAGAKGAARFVRPEGQPVGIAPARQEQSAKKANGKAQTAPAAPSSPVEVTSRFLGSKHARRAGVNGALFALTPKASAPATRAAKPPSGVPAAVTVDYSAFAESYGGSYASRMRLVQLPACALTTPDEADCRRATDLKATNDTAGQSLTADLMTLRTGAPTVLAATAAAAGDKGDFKATTLSPSSSWDTSLNTGDFSWSYDIPVPEVPGGFKPQIGLSYSSGAIDGRSGGTNNQGSWVGDGFDLWPGFIERRYKPCVDDGVKNADGSEPGDMCWAYDNAFISFNGASGELVPAGKDEFKLKKDDGTRIARLESADRANGDNDNEYWRLTTSNGTQYFFGYNRLPGWAAGKPTTDSTWTHPVYGNNTGEKCHGTTFATSWCQQAWRWNLDYAVDTHGNTVSYHYTKEDNSYGRNLKADDDTPYTRGGVLKRIDYGQKSNDLYATKPLSQVVFHSLERCLPQAGVTCDPDTIDAKSFYWYDTPWDLNCKAGTSCDNGRLSPSFWTRHRLTGITSQVLNTGGTYDKVDSWKLEHRWGMADTDYQLLLDSIQRTGESATPTIKLPKTTFSYTQLANRLDKNGDGYAPFVKDRLNHIDDEYGSSVVANYSTATCSWSALPTPETNTTRCFPQYLGGTSSEPAELHWFNKYVTTSVTTKDRTGGAPDEVTHYQYLGDAAWHYNDDDGLTKEKEKTWSQWRGYGQVRVQTGGDGGDVPLKTQQDSYFLRGMDGDRKDKSGGSKNVDVALGAGEGDPITDHESAAGFTYKSVTFDKPGGKVLEKSVQRPWHHETAKKVRDWGTVTANFTGASLSKQWVSLDNGAGAQWRTMSKSTKQDTIAGRVVQVEDRGDDAIATDDQCTRTTYPPVTSKNILGLTYRVETVAKACDVTQIDRAKDVVSDALAAYDGAAYGAAPAKGDLTAGAKLKSHDGTKATYLESTTAHDAYGRQTSMVDLSADVTVTGTSAPVRTARSGGLTTTTAYTPATGLPTQIKVTTPPATAGVATSSLTSTTTVDPRRNSTVKQTDANNNSTQIAYDALGRTAKVWQANRTTSQTPTEQFDYTITEGQPAAVAAKTLDNKGGQVTSWVLYDGYLRQRQTQAPGPEGGSILSDTFYDERGLPTKAFAPYYTTTKPSAKIFKPDNAWSVETQTHTAYDGLNRAVETQQVRGNGDGGKVLSTTRTIYGGDRTTVIPPVGATATTTLTDARGKTTELRQHHLRSASAPYDSTLYQHTRRGELSKVTGPDNNSWTYEYDQLGRQTKLTDPDKGPTESTYNDRGQLVFSKGSRTDVPGLAYVYDGLGRQIEVREGSATGTLRIKHEYDTVSRAKGHLAASTRYVGSKQYTTKVTQYDALYRAVRTSVVIPAAEGDEGKLAGTYQTGSTFLPSGLPDGTNYSAAGSLPGGSVGYAYEEQTLRPIQVYGQGISGTTSYSYTGKPLVHDVALTDGGKLTRITNSYEPGTQRLATTRVDREEQAGVDRHATYQYDEAGNILSIADVSRTGTDNQCFTYDYLTRLTEAWTQPVTTCAAAPAADKLGGPEPYWQSFTYDKAGNRKTETQHDSTGNTAKDISRVYTYPAAGAKNAHSLTSRTTTGPSGTNTESYAYDPAGNTTTRPGQKLTWDAEGHLATVTENSNTTSYLYDAGGNRLIGRTPTEVTLYLGHTEVTVRKGADKAEATRYFDLGGGQTAIRSDDGTFSFTVADHHGTGELAIQANTLAITQRRTLPFGEIRGQTPTTWPGTRGFVGGTDDTKTTGLTHLGAREYDPDLGRFISVDPILDLADPQQMNGYNYANNNPTTLSDPTGLRPDGACGGTGSCGADTGNWTKTQDGWDYKETQTESSLPQDSGSGNTEGDNEGAGKPKPIDKQPLIEGVRLPTKAELYAQNYSMGDPNVSYSEMIVKWADGKCMDDPGSAFCETAHELGWISPTKDFLELIGVRDAIRCAEGSASACIWTAAGFTPVGKIAKAAKAAKLAKAALDCNSFLPDTKVLMADGTHKEISEVKVGEEILATDPKTGETKPKKVTREILGNGQKTLVEITIAPTETSGPNSVIKTTGNHPFWVPDLKEWVDAAELRSGQSLLNSDGSLERIASVKNWSQVAEVHNLTVEDLHTYYVLAGQTPVLVHNSNCDVILGAGEGAADALRAFTSTKPETEFVFDSGAGKFLAGDRDRIPGGLSPHEQLAVKADMDRGTVLGGTLFRDNGRLVFTENSGHYGHRWTDATRQQFQKFMSDQGIDFDYRPWG
ncbi:polymorphic toxin-type HINT domain-containing protein [Streptomyces rubiginosohelvolus]|uniref:polymorphic toxin-type HINT domain-containing protein n=1 Tax=Streptomyces rubiginosohelvolus TaxID=67362 RepID=UPI0033DA6CAD